SLGHGRSYAWAMRWLAIFSILLCCLVLAPVTHAAEGRIIKVLPQLLDLKGRNSLSPSLYDRDAYQMQLRNHPKQVSTLRFNVEWKAKVPKTEELKLRVELRGAVLEKKAKEAMVEKVLTERYRLNHWTTVDLTEAAYKEFGEVTAWRVTLWHDNQMISEQKSFLW
ncbi:MAG: hypothetical protein JWQ71_323, partial [Pedosphaera sp.]|nr:hypothetical protein [Pedosphaera sp.]